MAALNILGILLAAAGRHSEALAAAQRAVGIRRRLARTNPAAYEPNLARSLATYARVRVEGRRDLPAALEAVQESAEIFHRLTQALPLAFDDLLHVVLDIQADILDQLGRTKEATRIRPPQL